MPHRSRRPPIATLSPWMTVMISAIAAHNRTPMS